MIKLPKIKDELLPFHFNRPDWTKGSRRSNSLLFLDKNENTDVEYINFIQEKLANIGLNDINNYPDCSVLYHKLAADLDVSSSNLLLAAGSDGIIRHAFETFVARGNTVVYTDPSFAMYSVYSDMFGAKSCRVGYVKKEGHLVLDLELFLKNIYDNQPALVCLPNPDSPTGSLVSESQLILIIEAAEEVGAAVLIDEAYYPFSEYTALPLIPFYANLIVVRTLSKAWGLAGVRVGYAVANHDLISYLHKVRPMYELGALSVAIATKALNYKSEMLASVKRLEEGKKYFKNQMMRLGFNTLCSAGNFQHIAFGEHAEEIHLQLSDLVLYRQDFPGTVLEGYSRFSSATRSTFEKIVAQIETTLQIDTLELE